MVIYMYIAPGQGQTIPGAVGVDYRTPMREALGSRHNSTIQVVFMNLYRSAG